MSLYNLVHGVHPLAPTLLDALGISHHEVARIRDVFLVQPDADAEVLICIYTRTGGGNRDDYAEENAALTRVPGYVRDEDDSFDSTYACFYFRIPAAIEEAMQNLLEEARKQDKLELVLPPPPAERWKRVTELMRKMP